MRSLEFGCERPTVLSEKFCMGVRDLGIIRKVLYGCERLAVLSRKFYVGVRDPWCEPKSFVAQRRHTVIVIT